MHYCWCSCCFVLWLGSILLCSLCITGIHPMDNSMSSSTALPSFTTSISASPVFLPGPAHVGTPSFSRQHFSPHPWNASTSCKPLWCRCTMEHITFYKNILLMCSFWWPLHFSLILGESPVPSVSSGASSPLCTSTVTPALIQAKPSSSNQQDRKVPPPIGTERLARIRQTGTVNHTMLTTSYTPPVGQGGIWSFGVGSASGESVI